MMSRPTKVILAALALLLVGTVGLALLVSYSLNNRAVGTVLVYEADSTGFAPGETVDIDALVAAIDQRFRGTWPKIARVSAHGNGQIKVEVFGTSPETTRYVESMLTISGTLEFRIVANSHDHPSLMERARADPAKQLTDSDGNVVAWWVPVAEGQDISPTSDPPEFLTRPSKQNDGATQEILVVKDPYDVTGCYLADVSAGTDYRGGPAINFSFNAQGAKRFGGLTGSNLPDRASGFFRQLAIILNGTIHSAPRINSTIFDRGIIEGQFTRQEVEDLVSILNAGSLPAPVRLVDKQVIEQSE